MRRLKERKEGAMGMGTGRGVVSDTPQEGCLPWSIHTSVRRKDRPQI